MGTKNGTRENIKNIINDLTLEEKAYLLSGKDFWRTQPIERHNIPSILMIDGPHGLRKQVDKSDHLGLNAAQNAICFPTASAMASTFDEQLMEEVGQLLGEEAQAENVGILLGPGNNIKRSPLCGRNFEYFSEDPFLAGKLAAAEIRGVQSKGVGTSLKHFVANNQETLRNVVSAKIDERTLREIYLTAFEIPVKEGQPWTVMNSYNRINGTYLAENSYLLKEVLKDQWGFEGMVISDWGASDHLNNSIKNGMDLEMPSSGVAGPKKIIKAIKNGTMKMSELDEAVGRVLNTMMKVRDQKNYVGPYDKDLHHQKAREAARDCMVLLKNDNNILPIDPSKNQSIALIGDFGKNPRFQGGGSSHINPYKLDTLWDEMSALKGEFTLSYAKGYDSDDDHVDQGLLDQAVVVAGTSDMVIISVGLIEVYETEGLDRHHLDMPPNHLALIDAVSKVNDKIVVVLSNGSPIKMPFESQVSGILETWLTGQAGAGAAVDVLFGLHNPSGKLAETFIRDITQDPSYGNFPGDKEVIYNEGLYVGYRYHDRYETDVLYEFGYGLSYTTFEYSNLSIDKKSAKETDTVKVSVDVTNTGSIEGKESLQLYVSELKPIVDRPNKELKGFGKVSLKPGETKTVTMTLNKRSFAFYHVDLKDWVVNSGEFEIGIGSSSKNILLKEVITIESEFALTPPKEPLQYLNAVEVKPSNVINRHTYVVEIKDHPIGKRVYNNALKQVDLWAGSADKTSDEGGSSDFNRVAIEAMVMYSPFRNMVNMTAGEHMTEFKLTMMIKLLNLTRKDRILGKVLNLFTKA